MLYLAKLLYYKFQHNQPLLGAIVYWLMPVYIYTHLPLVFVSKQTIANLTENNSKIETSNLFRVIYMGGGIRYGPGDSASKSCIFKIISFRFPTYYYPNPYIHVHNGNYFLSVANFLFKFFLLNKSTATAQRCPIYWVMYGQSCYRFRYVNLMTWTDAKTQCRSQGGDLIKFETTGEYVSIVITIRLGLTVALINTSTKVILREHKRGLL